MIKKINITASGKAINLTIPIKYGFIDVNSLIKGTPAKTAPVSNIAGALWQLPASVKVSVNILGKVIEVALVNNPKITPKYTPSIGGDHKKASFSLVVLSLTFAPSEVSTVKT